MQEVTGSIPVSPTTLMEKKDYLIQVKVPLKCIDDVDARFQLREIRKDWSKHIESPEAVIKLQALVQGKQPRKIEFTD